MATRAILIDFLLAGIRDPDTDEPLNAGTAEFYAAGTSTPKNVWTEEAQTNAYTSYTLGADGTAELFGFGDYKIVLKDSAGNTEYTIDDYKCEAVEFIIQEKSGNYTAEVDDDVVLVDTSGGDVTITLPAIATALRPLVIKNTGSNNVIIDGNSTETIDGATTYTLGFENFSVTLYPGSAEWKKYVPHDKLQDGDGDTYIDLDVSDDDKIHLEALAIIPDTDDTTDLGASGNEFKDGYFDGTVYVDAISALFGAYAITLPTNNATGAAKFLTGDASTIAWFYLNTAPPGWKALATGADSVLAVSGGSDDYNVNGGNPDSSETWAISGLTKDEHTHTGPSHNHMWYDAVDTSNDDKTFDSGGSSYSPAAQTKVSGGNTLFDKYDITSTGLDGPSGDLYTNNSGTGNTGGQSDSGVTSDGGWRPKASVGKLFQFDTA